MKNTKYIVYQTPNGNEEMIIFSATQNHRTIANKFITEINGNKIVSAGFISIYPGNDELIINCYGDSISLEVKSRPEKDKKIAKFILNNNMF
jgi:hypothetical protein